MAIRDNKHLILTIDDDQMFFHHVKHSLVNHDHHYLDKSSDAIRTIISIDPNLIILDKSFSQEDHNGGFAILDSLKNHPGVKPTPVIFVTGSDERDIGLLQITPDSNNLSARVRISTGVLYTCDLEGIRQTFGKTAI